MQKILSQLINDSTSGDFVRYAAFSILPLFYSYTFLYPEEFSRYLVYKAGIHCNSSILVPGSVIRRKSDFVLVSLATSSYVIGHLFYTF